MTTDLSKRRFLMSAAGLAAAAAVGCGEAEAPANPPPPDPKAPAGPPTAFQKAAGKKK